MAAPGTPLEVAAARVAAIFLAAEERIAAEEQAERDAIRQAS